MSKELKYMMAEAVKTDLDRSPNLLVMGMLPMDAEATVALRSSLRSQGAQLRVIHNRTSRHALDEARKPLADLFVGQTAIAVANSTEETDFIGIAKTLVAAAKKKQVELRGGCVDGELFDAVGFTDLANCPDKPTLRAMLCGVILGPGRGIATLMNAVGSGMARCISEHAGDEPGDVAGGTEETAAETPEAASE